MLYLARKAYRVEVGDKLTIGGEVAKVIESTPVSDGYHLITYVSEIHPHGITCAYIRNATIPLA